MSVARAAGELRVAMVSPYSLERPGGVQGQVVGLAGALRRRGHHVTVLAPADGPARAGTPAGPPDGERVALGRAVGIRANGSVAPVTLSPAAPGRALAYVRRHGVDVVHLHEPLAPVAGYGLLWRSPVPVVATFHRAGASAAYRLLRPLAARARRHIAVACAVSEAARRTAEAVLGGGDADYEVLFNGVAVDRFARATPTPTGGRPTVVFVGRHEPRKGLGTLLEAFAGVPAPSRLWVVGAGRQTAELQRRYPGGDRVAWLGALPDDQVAERLAGADVLCAPATGGESFGLVVLEGMAARCAVLASDIEGYREAAGGHAELVPPGDVGAWRRALHETLGAVGPATGRSAPAALDAAFAHAERWSMDRLAEAYETRYRRALAGAGAGPGRATGSGGARGPR